MRLHVKSCITYLHTHTRTHTHTHLLLAGHVELGGEGSQLLFTALLLVGQLVLHSLHLHPHPLHLCLQLLRLLVHALGLAGKQRSLVRQLLVHFLDDQLLRQYLSTQILASLAQLLRGGGGERVRRRGGGGRRGEREEGGKRGMLVHVHVYTYCKR